MGSTALGFINVSILEKLNLIMHIMFFKSEFFVYIKNLFDVL